MGQMLPCLNCGSCWADRTEEEKCGVVFNKTEGKSKASSEAATSANQSPLIISPKQSANLPEEVYDFQRFFQPPELSAALPVYSDLSPVITYKYESTGVYIGQTLSRQRHGQGEMKWSSGDWYSGNWSEGMPLDIGTMHLSSGQQYQGEWLRRTFVGSSLLLDADPEYLEKWLAALNDGYGDI